MTATNESPDLDLAVGTRGEKRTVYGYVYEYVYGEEGGGYTSFGMDVFVTPVAPFDLKNDAVCGNGDTGIFVCGNSSSSTANGTGLGTMYNFGHGVLFEDLFGDIQFNDDSAFTANAACGFNNNSFPAVLAHAENNQWRGAVTTCTQSPDVCTGGGPIDCDPFQVASDVAIALDAEPTHPRNAMVKGQTLRVQGTGFNAIDGNPEAGTGAGQFDCELGSDDVSSANCCRNASKANVCATTGSPPDPPSDGSNCAAILDATNQWKALSVTSVTPTRIVTEVPDPALVCVGEGATQTMVHVVKQSAGGPIDDFGDYCRN